MTWLFVRGALVEENVAASRRFSGGIFRPIHSSAVPKRAFALVTVTTAVPGALSRILVRAGRSTHEARRFYEPANRG
jgi:hypothetical protein